MSPIFPIASVDPRFRLYTATDGQIEFAVPFPWQNNIDIVVLRTDLDDVTTTLNEAEHYQLTGAGSSTGGTLTLTEGNEAIEGEQFLILGRVQLTRAGSIVAGGRFRSRSTDDDLDRMILIAQEVQRELGRALRTAYGVSGAEVDVGEDNVLPVWRNGRLEAGPVWGDELGIPGPGVPVGGTTGQLLAKQSNVDFATGWIDFVPETAIYVNTRTALKALDTATHKVAILTEAGRAGLFLWTLGNYTTLHAADSQEGVHVKADAVASGTGSWVRVYAEALNAKWFGAVGDNSTFDSTALQCWVNVAALLGATAYAPGGSYVVNATIVIPPAPTSVPPRPYCSIRGAGKGATAFRVRAADDIAVFSYSGSLSGGGVNGFTTFEKFTVTSGGTGTQKFGFLIDNMAFFAVRDVAFSGLTVGVKATDILSCEFQSCEARFNGGGFHLQQGDASPPNNITFLDCEIGANTDYAIYAYQPSNLRILGGAIEGNGNGAGDVAVTVVDGGYGGGNGLFMEGVYVEANTGDADVWIDQNSGLACSHWIAGNTFSRVGSTSYVTNNIKLTCDTATAFAPTIMSNGFKGFGGYTPNAGRLYVDTSGCAGTAWSVLYEGNLFESATEAPKLGPRITSVANINLASQFDTRAPQHVAGRWYAPLPLNTAANTAFGQNVIGLQMFTLGDTVTIDQLGTYVSTLSAAGNLQLAIYANDPAAGLPTGEPLLKTGNISTAATGTVSAAVVANAQLKPGLYWMAAMMDNATAAVVGYQGAMPLQPFFSGSATLTDIASSSSVFDFVIRVTNTFASGWPDLTSATKTVTPGTLAPVVFFRTASVP